MQVTSSAPHQCLDERFVLVKGFCECIDRRLEVTCRAEFVAFCSKPHRIGIANSNVVEQGILLQVATVFDHNWTAAAEYSRRLYEQLFDEVVQYFLRFFRNFKYLHTAILQSQLSINLLDSIVDAYVVCDIFSLQTFKRSIGTPQFFTQLTKSVIHHAFHPQHFPFPLL